MPINKVKQFLDSESVRYVTVTHSPAYTAQEIAAAAHIPGKNLAKTVIVKLDGAMAMAVLPATRKLDLDLLREASNAALVEMATEQQFADEFAGCEIGAMPPFGNLYDMPVYVAESLVEDQYIAFSAGSHTELIQLAYADFARLVQPTVAPLSR